MQPFNLPWTATWFCTALSITAFVVDFAKMVILRQPEGLGSLTSFLAFLPMCFYFLGLAVSRQSQEINELRRQVAELQTKAAN